MSADEQPEPASCALIGLIVIDGLIAGGWALLVMFGLSIGSPGPSASDVLLPLLPSILVFAVAVAAGRKLKQEEPNAAFTLAAAALPVVPLFAAFCAIHAGAFGP